MELKMACLSELGSNQRNLIKVLEPGLPRGTAQCNCILQGCQGNWQITEILPPAIYRAITFGNGNGRVPRGRVRRHRL